MIKYIQQTEAKSSGAMPETTSSAQQAETTSSTVTTAMILSTAVTEMITSMAVQVMTFSTVVMEMIPITLRKITEMTLFMTQRETTILYLPTEFQPMITICQLTQNSDLF